MRRDVGPFLQKIAVIIVVSSSGQDSAPTTSRALWLCVNIAVESPLIACEHRMHVSRKYPYADRVRHKLAFARTQKRVSMGCH